MKTTKREGNFSCNLGRILARTFVVAGFLLCANVSLAQLLPPDPYFQLSTWSFNDTSWYSDLGYAPVSFTNLNNPPSFDGNALQVDSTNTAWLQYNITESDGTNNLTFNAGTIELWVLPDWNSGTGPGDWGRLIDVGAYSTNSPSSWLSLYFSPDGTSLYFSSETNGVFTNYLNYPISWDTNTWHLIDLTYAHFRSELYVDGQLATNGPGVFYLPSADVVSNGFFVGSDNTGTAQSRAQIDDMATYNYPLSEYDISNDYAAGLQIMNGVGFSGGGFHADDSPPDVGGGGGSGTNDYGGWTPPDYGTNLWIAQVAILSSNLTLTGMASNSQADIEYEIQSKTDLLQTNWSSEGFILGSELTNWTPLSVAQNGRTNLFLRLKSWADDGSGLPIWWQLQYFGTNGVDPNALDSAGDGWTIYQKFQMGLNPNVFYAPPTPQDLTVVYNNNNDTANVSWQPSPGPVTGYTVERDDDSGATDFSFSASTNGFNDNISSDTPDPDYGGDIEASYKIEAQYTNGNSAWSASISVEQNTINAVIISGSQGTAYLAVSALPPNTAAIRLTEDDFASLYNVIATNYDIPIGNFTNGLCPLPNNKMQGAGDNYSEHIWIGQAVGTNGLGLTAVVGLSGDYASPLDDYQSGWLVTPFFDGRAQLKQNLIFQLRAATMDDFFHFSDVYPADRENFPVAYLTNYVCSGYYGFFVYGSGDDIAYTPILDTLLPVENNYLFKNFVFDSSRLDSNGRTTTGVGGNYSHYYYNPYTNGFSDYIYADLILEQPPLYQFSSAPTANGETIAPLLATNETRWLSTYPLDSDNSYLPEIGITNDTSYSPPIFAMYSNAKNYYGLPFLSAAVGYGSGAAVELDAGSSTTQGGYFYPETAQPQFETVEYDYWYAPNSFFNVFTNGTDYPGMAGLSLTHTNPVLITAVGNAYFQIACYAKLAVVNGYSGVYGYLQQYFDKAYEITNGIVTTNATGVLSPYGQFFATEPGPAALVTMPDVDTGERGTDAVYCVSLNVDANHDGNMDLTFNSPDATSQASPDEVWVNDGHDQAGANGNLDKDLEVPPASPNYAAGEITCPRDLENLFRLWVCGLPQLPTSQGYTVTLSMSPLSGNPAINLYYSCETNGGIGYLTDTNIAATQAGSSYYDDALCTISNNQSCTLQMDSYGNLLYTNYLFEGTGIGEGQLTLTISQNSNVICQTSAYLDLHDIKDFYERAVITENTSGAISNWSSTVESVQSQTAAISDEDSNIVVFVHGINVGNWNWLDDSDTVFKRLYWANYHGKFSSVNWPCNPINYTTFLTLDIDDFNESEIKAYKASTSLKTYLTGLHTRFPSDRLNLFAHSQGNAVVSEAIEQGAPFDTYIITQGALPASCYDVNAATNSALLSPEYLYPTPEQQPMGYRGVYTNLTGNIVSFYNSEDPVLNYWLDAQELFKPSFDYSFDGTNSFYSSFFSSYQVTDPQESRANVSRSRTFSIGQQGAEGAINATVDLHAQFGFNGDSTDEHSAQWTRPIQTSLPYYAQILTSLNP